MRGEEHMPTIFIIGDSTVEDNTPPFRGWGWALKNYVAAGCTVKNYACSGCSSRSFFEKGLLDPVKKEIRAGDLLLIQFGHNDEKDDERHTDPENTFPAFLRHYCRTAAEKEATPVLITPVCRRYFVGDGGLLYTHGEYPLAVRNVAREDGIALCDLNRDSRKLYLTLGEEKTAELFVRLQPGEHPDFPDGHDDRTHFCAVGAERIARLLAEELSALPVCRKFISL